MNLETSLARIVSAETMTFCGGLLKTGLALCLLGILAGGAQPNLSAAEASNAASKGFLLIANKGDQTLGIIDPEVGGQVATVPEDGVTGHEVAASPDGKRAFVTIYGNS